MEVEGGAGKGKGGKAKAKAKAKARQGSAPDHVCSRAEGRQPRIFIIIFLYLFSRTRTSSRSRCHPTYLTYASSLLPYCAPASQLLDRRASREEEHTLAAGSQPKSCSAPQAAVDM